MYYSFEATASFEGQNLGVCVCLCVKLYHYLSSFHNKEKAWFESGEPDI